MAGGLIQLMAYGSQNQYLMGNPQITFFRMVYRRHTNFSMESIKQFFNNRSELTNNGVTKITCKIDRHGDLVSNIYFCFTLPDIYSDETYAFKWIKNIGTTIIKEINITIGGNIIDRQYGEWLNIWNELSLTNDKIEIYNKMTGNTLEFYDPANANNRNDIYPSHTKDSGIPSIYGRKLYIPLQFWFNRNPGLAIPLIALQYHNIEINVELRTINELYVIKSNDINKTEYVAPDPTIPEQNITNFIIDGVKVDSLTGTSKFGGLDIGAYLEVNYIFLDNDERNKFAQQSHEYIIEQVYKTEKIGINGNTGFDLVLQHPVKELIWVTKRNDLELRNDWNNYTNLSENDIPIDTTTKNILLNARLSFNGIDRFETKDAEYFNLIQPYQHHTHGPKDGIYVYSFSIEPEKFQPSGSCNMSRINNIILYLETIFNDNMIYNVTLYAVNYNVLRIMAGMGGLAFST